MLRTKYGQSSSYGTAHLSVCPLQRKMINTYLMTVYQKKKADV